MPHPTPNLNANGIVPNRIAALRRARGWAPTDLAAKLDISTMTLWRWEASVRSPPDAARVRLAALFGCRVSDVFLFDAGASAGDAPETTDSTVREETGN